MTRWLLIGDPHVVVDELEDCKALINGIGETIKSENPDFVVFLGDQFHNHAVLRLEVLGFWRESFQKLIEYGKPIYALVGNHDQTGDGASECHAMMAFADMPGITVVDGPFVYSNKDCNILLIPYYHDNQNVRNCILMSPMQKIVICHATFDGALYENGFYAKDGVSLEGLEDRQIISGHIHTPHKFANVTYIGAPRWRSLSDANVDRGLALVDVVNGKAEITKIIDTSKWCRKLLHIVDKQEVPYDGEVNPNWRYVVDIHGTEDYIKSRKAKWAGQRIRSFRTQDAIPKVRESLGVSEAIRTFVEAYNPRFGTDLNVLKEMVATRI